MKYIKTYEGLSDYNIGDYVLLAEKANWRSRVAIILDKQQQPFQFLVKAFFLESGKKFITWCNYGELSKKITFEEFTELKKEDFINYKLKKASAKYNL